MVTPYITVAALTIAMPGPDGMIALNPMVVAVVLLLLAALAVTLVTLLLRQRRWREQKKVLQHKAERDPLTGLYNRAACELLIDRYLQTAPPDALNAFILLDLDDFKSINDRYGHLFGDSVLSLIGTALLHTFRNNDIIGRLGGDEFIVYLKDIKTRAQAEKKAAELCALFLELGTDQHAPVYCSVGIDLDDSGRRFIDLYRRADLALHQAKLRGKNTYVIYDNTLPPCFC